MLCRFAFASLLGCVFAAVVASQGSGQTFDVGFSRADTWDGFPQVDAIAREEYTQLREKLDPGTEKWKSIPWTTSLVAAQRQAASERKLLFIWAMDGNPLGCT